MSDRKIFHKSKVTYIYIYKYIYICLRDPGNRQDGWTRIALRSRIVTDYKTHVLTLPKSGRIIVFYENERSWFFPTDLINVSSEELVSMTWRTINSHKSVILLVHCTIIFLNIFCHTSQVICFFFSKYLHSHFYSFRSLREWQDLSSVMIECVFHETSIWKSWVVIVVISMMKCWNWKSFRN